jgi:hypothetical protein
MFKNILRLAIIERTNYRNQTVTIRMLDRVDGRKFECPIPHPAVMGSSGIFASPSSGTVVIVGFTYREAPLIIGYLPLSSFAEDLTSSENTGNFLSDDTEYPKLNPGELAVQGLSNSKMLFDKKGNICLQFGESEISYTNNDIISEKTGEKYSNTSAHRQISGKIKRDVRTKTRRVEAVFDKLSRASYDDVLTVIGRNPNFTYVPVSGGKASTEILRNPALVENRELVYEFAIEDNIGSFEEERKRIAEKEIFPLEEPSRRDMSRADILNLNPLVPGNLIESVKGTVVDIYGNILDINRSTISYEGISPKNVADSNGGGIYARAEIEDKLLRRSIKYHMEINSKKKPVKEFVFDDVDAEQPGLEAIGYSHSRWSIDVDGEGLTKINIPASTDTGNIPLLTRHTNSNARRGDESDAFRDPDNPVLDILHLGFGENAGDGVSVTDTYAPANIGNRFAQEKIKYRTAYHDIVATASDMRADNAISDSISNALNDDSANAGGRSLHLNADGSMELNIGKDTVDGKSLVQDLAGGIVSRIGKDFNENSMVTQFDGNINIQVGGDSIETESKVTSPGVNFYVAHEDGFHKIEVNANGIFIQSAPNTNIVIDSQRNLVLKSKGSTLLHGDNVYIHGTSDDTGNSVTGERLVMRSGRKVF